MTPKLSPGAAQMLLPFMEKLAASPKAEQPFQQLLALGRMVGTEGTAAPSPWQRLMQIVPKYRSPEGLLLHPGNVRGGVPTALEFNFKPPGMPEQLGGNVVRGGKPDEAYLSYMGSELSPRAGVGNSAAGMQDYNFDISSPAQRELPLRGMKLPPQEKAQRALREPEDRLPATGFGYANSGATVGPRATMGQKQQATDRFLDVLRRAGFKNLSFSAEPGERPRLYEKMTGYKAQPQGETDVVDLISRSFGGERRGRYSQPFGAGEMSPQRNMTPEGVESALGLSIDEAHAAGLVEPVGPNVFRLNGRGVEAARNWLGGS